MFVDGNTLVFVVLIIAIACFIVGFLVGFRAGVHSTLGHIVEMVMPPTKVRRQ